MLFFINAKIKCFQVFLIKISNCQAKSKITDFSRAKSCHDNYDAPTVSPNADLVAHEHDTDATTYVRKSRIKIHCILQVDMMDIK